jgi:hypothetical protein
MADQKPHLIELKLHDINQLFNSMDPAPFYRKDLDQDAEEFIVSWAEEYPSQAPVMLRVYLEQWPSEDPAKVIKGAIQNYFTYRAGLNNMEFHRLMRIGQQSLIIGLVFLALCLFISNVLVPKTAFAVYDFLREGFTIAGWVAMWRPMEVYLYDWWPIKRRGRIYTKLSQSPVEVIGQTEKPS